MDSLETIIKKRNSKVQLEHFLDIYDNRMTDYLTKSELLEAIFQLEGFIEMCNQAFCLRGKTGFESGITHLFSLKYYKDASLFFKNLYSRK